MIANRNRLFLSFIYSFFIFAFSFPVLSQNSSRKATPSAINSIVSTTINNSFNAAYSSILPGGGGLYRWSMSEFKNYQPQNTYSNSDPFVGDQAFSYQITSGLKSGRAASDEESNVSIWFTPVYSRFENSIEPLTSKGSVSLGLMGIEYNYEDEIIAGVTIALDKTRAQTIYNDGNLLGNGYTLAPYFVYQIDASRALDISFGAGRTQYESLVNGATSSPQTRRQLFSAGFTQAKISGKWMTLVKVGIAEMKDDVPVFVQGDNTNSDPSGTRMVQGKVGGQLSYRAGKFSPFVAGYMFSNNFTTYGTGTQPKEYTSTPQIQLGVNASSGPVFGAAVFQAERDRKQLRVYGGIRY